jgi:dihydropyrimidinase
MQADKVIDAAGKYVLPGCVDPHTHLDMPFGGTVTIDDVYRWIELSEECYRSAAQDGATVALPLKAQSYSGNLTD